MIELRLLCCFRGKLLELTNFHEGFREALPYWLKKAFRTTQDRVERAVQVDQVTYYYNTTPRIEWNSTHSSIKTTILPPILLPAEAGLQPLHKVKYTHLQAICGSLTNLQLIPFSVCSSSVGYTFYLLMHLLKINYLYHPIIPAITFYD